jgi:hypothetical protein
VDPNTATWVAGIIGGLGGGLLGALGASGAAWRQRKGDDRRGRNDALVRAVAEMYAAGLELHYAALRMARARASSQQAEVRGLEVELAHLAGRMVAADTVVNLNEDGPQLVNSAAAVMQAMGHLVDQASGTDPPLTDLSPQQEALNAALRALRDATRELIGRPTLEFTDPELMAAEMPS